MGSGACGGVDLKWFTYTLLHEALLDRIGQVAQIGSPTSQTALGLLERVAEGRTDSISADSESQLGLNPGELKKPEFRDATVRAHALRAIGQSDLPEALGYLKSLRLDRLPPDDTQQVSVAARIAIHEAMLTRIPDLPGKIELLEKTVKDEREAVPWAIEELCNRGILTSLPVVEDSIRKGESAERAEEEIQFCEARIRAVSRDPDRAKALGSVLNVENGSLNHRLVYWAIDQLDSMRAPKADAELDRFAGQIQRLPEGSPERLEFGAFGQLIRELRAQRLR